MVDSQEVEGASSAPEKQIRKKLSATDQPGNGILDHLIYCLNIAPLAED